MPQLAADLATMFADLPLPERFRAAKAAGFDAVELALPYDHPTQELRDQLVWNDLAFTLLACPPPNATGGPQGFAGVPGREERFRRDFDRTMRFAGVLKPRHVRILAGPAETGAAEATLVENLRWAAARAPRQLLLLGPEPGPESGPDSGPGALLADHAAAARLIAAAGIATLGLLLDARSLNPAGQLAAWAAHGACIAHVRTTAPAPDLLARLDADGYAGWIAVSAGT